MAKVVQFGVPPLVLAIGLALTAGWSVLERHEEFDGEARRFEEISAHVAERIDERLMIGEQILLDVASFAGMNPKAAEVLDWREYMSRISLDGERDLGRSIGFLPRITNRDLARHELERQRAGVPGYHVWPPGDRPVYFPVAKLEPPAQAATALGYDGYSDPARRPAMDRAIATGNAAMTGLVHLKSFVGESNTPAYIVYAPVFAGPARDADAMDDRRVVALVGSARRLSDLLTSVLHKSREQVAVAMCSRPCPLVAPVFYDAGGPVPPRAEPAMFSARRTIEHSGQVWELWFASTPASEAAFLARRSRQPWSIGVVATVLLTLIAWGADRNRRRVLSESETRFRSMADATPMPLRLLDADLGCTYVNPAYVAIAHGTPDAQLGDGWRDAVHPDDRAAVEAVLRSAAEGDGAYEVEYRLRQPDGGYAWILERGEPRHGEHGRWEGCAGILIDLTERRHAEASVEAAVWAAEIGLWSWDVGTGKVVYSPEYKAQLGLRPDEMEDTFEAWSARVHPDDLPPATASIQAALTSDLRRFEARFRLRHKDGSWRHILSRALVERDRDGKPIRMLGGHLDVTEFHDAQEDLRRHRDHLERLVAERTADLLEAKNVAENANIAKSEFLANMSHEMRTPMHAILSFTGLARRKVSRPEAEPEALLGYLTRIDDSGRRLLRLLNDLLDLSRLEAGMMQYEVGSHVAATIVQAVVAELEPMALDKGVRLVVPEIDRDLSARCDGARIEQVLRNLIANAIRFTPAGKEVRVGVSAGRFDPTVEEPDRPPRRAVCFSVSDDGVGIPENERESVFDKFVQSSRTKTGAGGTGLGLAIVRQIVSHHDGIVTVRESPSGGAEFLVSIPAGPAVRQDADVPGEVLEPAA